MRRSLADNGPLQLSSSGGNRMIFCVFDGFFKSSPQTQIPRPRTAVFPSPCE
jgi:hypothetical protein